MRKLPAAALALLCLIAVVPGESVAHVIGCAPSVAGSSDWPMIGRDVSSSRAQTDFAFDLISTPTLHPSWTFDANRWTHDANNEVTGYPVVSNGCVFVGSSTGNDASGVHLPGWVFALNADTGDVVWQTQVAGGVYSTVAVGNGVVYAFVSRVSSPFVVALDQRTGAVLWQRTVDDQVGSDAVSSPVVYDGLLWVGVSGTAAEGSATDRVAFQGSTVLLATKRMRVPSFDPPDATTARGWRWVRPGEVVRKLYSIPPSAWHQGYAGGSQWGTIAIDPTTGYGYEGTGNPFNYDHEHPHTNAVLKLDLDLRRRTFGQWVGSYKGDIETYVQQGASLVPCNELQQLPTTTGTGVECVHLDLDFGATPNLLTDPTGRRVLIVGQKSGVVHVIDARSMRGITKVRLGVPSPVGGMVGSAATDGKSVFGPHSIGGYLYAVSATGAPEWVSPVGDGLHWGPPVTLANGELFTVDLKGFLDVYDSGSGRLVAALPIQVGSDMATLTNPPLSWGGATVSRHTVFVSVGVGLTSAGLPSMPDGFVVAYQPRRLPSP